jgi:hypothetical protein
MEKRSPIMNLPTLLRATVLAACMVLPAAGLAQTVLNVTTPEKSVAFSLEELLAMPQTTVVTKNDYVDNTTEFQGPLLSAILERLEIDRSANLKMVALNDFASEVPASDAYDFNVILAVLREGERMPVRDKGPIWVIYPMDDNPELQDEAYNGRLVWQLKEISVE